MPEPTIQHLDKKIEKAIKLYERGLSFDEFPDELKSSFERWSVAHEVKLKFHHKGDDFVREMYKKRFDLDDTSARMDLRASEMFFGKIKQTNRNYERILRIEFLKKVSYKAFADGKYGEVSKIEAILQKYLDPTHDPIDMPDWEEMRKAVQPVIVFEPELLGIVRMPEKEIAALLRKVQSKHSIEIQDAEIIDNKAFSTDKAEDDYA